MTELSPTDPTHTIYPVTGRKSTSTRRTRYRMLAVGGLAAAVIAGGGAVAVAASQSPSAPTAGSHPGGYGPGGHGPAGYGSAGYGPGMPGSGARPPGGASTAPRARTPHLEGTVVSSSASTIVITDLDGFQRTIKVSATTKFSDGLSASIAKSTVIHAEGTVDADKTSLDATSIGKFTASDHGPMPGKPAAPAA